MSLSVAQAEQAREKEKRRRMKEKISRLSNPRKKPIHSPSFADQTGPQPRKKKKGTVKTERKSDGLWMRGKRGGKRDRLSLFLMFRPRKGRGSTVKYRQKEGEGGKEVEVIFLNSYAKKE